MRSRLHALHAALLLIFTSLAIVVPSATTPAPAVADDTSQIFFPVQVTSQLRYSNTWGAARSGGRSHVGVDIMSPQMTPAYAAQSGTVYQHQGSCRVGQYCSSYYLLISGDDGRSYFYVHLNSDTPGRPNGCDNRGGVENAFSPDLVEYFNQHGTLKGARVTRGQLVGYVGSSGNAACNGPHIHFEVWNGHGWGAGKTNPYYPVKAAQDAGNVVLQGQAAPSAIPTPTAPPLPDPEATDRLAGSDRVETAIDVSRESFAAAPAAVVVAGGRYEEALVAAPLAAAVGGPILLLGHGTSATSLDGRVADELRRLDVSKVIIVGNDWQVSAKVRQELADAIGGKLASVARVAGADKYATSAAVAREVLQARGVATGSGALGADGKGAVQTFVVGPDTASARAKSAAKRPSVSVLVAIGERDGGDAWPDALVASVLASREVTPILLTRPDRLPSDTADVLGLADVTQARLIGGTSALSEKVEQQIRALGVSTRRLAGADRFATAAAVADELLAQVGGSLTTVAVSTGSNFPDAIAAGPGLAEQGVPLLLVAGQREDQPKAVQDWLRAHASDIDLVMTLGGTSAIADVAARRVAVYANWPR